MEFLIYFALLTICDITAILFARFYVEKKKLLYCFISLFSFAMSAFLFVKLMAYRSTAVVNILWVSLSTIFITIVCYFLFKEKITLRQGLGIAVIIAGIVIMEF